MPLEPIKFDLIPEALFVLLTPEMVANVTVDVADAARAKWVILAGEELESTFQDYVTGIQPVEVEGSGGNIVARIVLVGDWPNMIENGYGPFDMRDTLLKEGSRLRRISKEGHAYGYVPFRTKTEGARGRTFTNAYAEVLGKKRAAALGRLIHKKAKLLAATTGRTAKGYQALRGGRLPAGLAPKLKAHHKTDIFAGMVRFQQIAGGGFRYGTFRTISEKVPDGWQMPHVEGKHLAKKVQEYVRRIAPLRAKQVIEMAL